MYSGLVGPEGILYVSRYYRVDVCIGLLFRTEYRAVVVAVSVGAHSSAAAYVFVHVVDSQCLRKLPERMNVSDRGGVPRRRAL